MMRPTATETACGLIAWTCSGAGKSRRGDRRPGLTLVELMLAVSLSSLMMVGIAAATITVGRMLYRNMAEAEVTQSIRVVEGTIARDVRSARTISLSGDSVLLDIGADQVKYGTISHADGHTELVRVSANEGTRRYFLRNVTELTFVIPPTGNPELFVNIECHIRVGGGNDVRWTLFNRFTSRVQ